MSHEDGRHTTATLSRHNHENHHASHRRRCRLTHTALALIHDTARLPQALLICCLLIAAYALLSLRYHINQGINAPPVTITLLRQSPRHASGRATFTRQSTTVALRYRPRHGTRLYGYIVLRRYYRWRSLRHSTLPYADSQ